MLAGPDLRARIDRFYAYALVPDRSFEDVYAELLQLQQDLGKAEGLMYHGKGESWRVGLCGSTLRYGHASVNVATWDKVYIDCPACRQIVFTPAWLVALRAASARA